MVVLDAIRRNLNLSTALNGGLVAANAVMYRHRASPYDREFAARGSPIRELRTGVPKMLPRVFVPNLELLAWQNILSEPVGVFRPITCAIKTIVHMTTVAAIVLVKCNG